MMAFRTVGKFGGGNVWQIDSFQVFGERVWRINISTEKLLIVSTNLDGFSLGNKNKLPNPPQTSHYIVSHISTSLVMVE